jgi:cytoskeletal protein RodZ
MIFRKLNVNGALSSDMSNFGSSFKKAREAKGISLDRIAAETRISTRFLLAIENEDFTSLPGGIFNRGFVRAYAERIGLDPDQSVADYERLLKVHEPSEASVVTPLKEKGERNLYPLAIAGLVVVIVIFYLVTREASNTAQTAGPPPVSSVSSPAPQTTASPVAEPTVPGPALPPPTTAPEVTSAAPEPEALSPTSAVRIDIEISETTWIKVTADGTTVDPGEILEPGTTRHFTAQKSIILSLGNAGGLALKINDMPAKSIGKSGQVREVKITPENIKSFIG